MESENFISKILYQMYKYHFNFFSNFIDDNDKVLDLGSGTGHISKIISKKKKADVFACDVVNRMHFKDIKFKLYNSKKLPFKKNQFDKTLLMFVLHHCKTPEKVLVEAKRVTNKNIIILEDYYTNNFGKKIIMFFDSLFNKNADINMPYNFKTLEQWDSVFKKLKLKKIHQKTTIFFPIPIRKVIYVLEK